MFVLAYRYDSAGESRSCLLDDGEINTLKYVNK